MHISVMASAEKKQTPTFRIFNDDWSMEFFFILRFAKPQCLICHDTVAVIKITNIQRHYNTKDRAKYNKKFHQALKQKKRKLKV